MAQFDTARRSSSRKALGTVVAHTHTHTLTLSHSHSHTHTHILVLTHIPIIHTYSLTLVCAPLGSVSETLEICESGVYTSAGGVQHDISRVRVYTCACNATRATSPAHRNSRAVCRPAPHHTTPHHTTPHHTTPHHTRPPNQLWNRPFPRRMPPRASTAQTSRSRGAARPRRGPRRGRGRAGGTARTMGNKARVPPASSRAQESIPRPRPCPSRCSTARRWRPRGCWRTSCLRVTPGAAVTVAAGADATEGGLTTCAAHT
mmetsp:Transcript_108676/g.316166  ORF Transcript_108676/g.316166 Transcript_108676/m.316166 type:complete len:260 (-) Transcript_108676:1792-2571(-)